MTSFGWLYSINHPPGSCWSQDQMPVIFLAALAAVTLASALHDPPPPPNPKLHGHFRYDMPSSGDVPRCSRPDIFDFHEATLRHGKWHVSHSNFTHENTTRWYEGGDKRVKQCTFQRVSADQARECLHGKHIVLIGDSITRYMFDSLSVFVAYGENPDPTSFHPWDHPVSLWAEEHGCRALKTHIVRCDRFRWQKKLLSTLVDNRYLHVHGMNLSLFGYYNVARGHAPIGFFPRKEKYYSESHVPYNRSKGDWEGDLRNLTDVIANGFGQVDAVLVNSGLWKVKEFQDVKSAREQLQSVERLVKGGRKPIWMTTTITETLRPERLSESSPEDSPGYVAARSLGWPVLDRYGMVMSLVQLSDSLNLPRRQVFMDNAHFYPWATQEFNNVLLNMLCSLHR